MSIQICAAVVTASDTRGRHEDLTGSEIVEMLIDCGAVVVERMIVSDDLIEIRETLAGLASRDDINLIITSGGTGLSPRDNTPEATRAVIEQEAPGIAEAIRRETALQTPLAMLSRGVAGVKNGTLIINLPGSPKAARECFAVVRPVLQHAVEISSGGKPH
jgi:molybdenum cofactor synthesis domain-containing protein